MTTIYGYLVTYITGEYSEHKEYGFVTAGSRADAMQIIEKHYEDDGEDILIEVAVHTLIDENEMPCLIDQYQIGFFIDAAKQNGYSEEGE